MNPIIEAQLKHRSIRKFVDKPVDDGLLVDLIRAAQGAASGVETTASKTLRMRCAP